MPKLTLEDVAARQRGTVMVLAIVVRLLAEKGAIDHKKLIKLLDNLTLESDPYKPNPRLETIYYVLSVLKDEKPPPESGGE